MKPESLADLPNDTMSLDDAKSHLMAEGIILSDPREAEALARKYRDGENYLMASACYLSGTELCDGSSVVKGHLMVKKLKRLSMEMFDKHLMM